MYLPSIPLFLCIKLSYNMLYDILLKNIPHIYIHDAQVTIIQR